MGKNSLLHQFTVFHDVEVVGEGINHELLDDGIVVS